MIPWEESEVHQEGNYRFLRGCVIIATVVAALISLISGDWSILGYWLRIAACSDVKCGFCTFRSEST